jgi:YesN/AraC family two-component response regulator
MVMAAETPEKQSGAEADAKPTKKRVLFVDDEKNVLIGFRMLLRPMRDVLEVDVAENGRAALKMMETTRYEAMVTDIRMPDMDGADLLDAVAGKCPEMVRIVLTGVEDDALRKRLAKTAHLLLQKPCHFSELKFALEKVLDQ